MSKRILLIIIILLFILSPVYLQSSSDFERGIAYLLLKDPSYSGTFFSNYFNKNYNPIVKSGFAFLLNGKYNDAKKEFNRYLNMNFRSTEALVGISIAVSDMKQSTSIENLKKCIKLDKGFSAAYACLGYEYQKKENFPSAEKYYLLALQYGKISEFKILLGDFYLKVGNPGKTVELINADVDLSPDNFQINFLMAKALFKMNRISEMTKYINICLELSGNSKDVRQLYAGYLYKRGKYSQAKNVLKSFKFMKKFDKEYIKLYAKTLIKTGDKKAKALLYELFSKCPWDDEVNYLLGQYYLKNKNEKSNIQNWIFRAILSGNNLSKLREIFSENYIYPQIKRIGFFKALNLFWLDNSTIAISAQMRSGENERVFLIDANSKRIINSFSFKGKYKGMFLSSARDKIVVISSVTSGVFAYSIIKKGKRWIFQKLNYRVLPLKNAKVGFNASGSLAYIVEGNIDKLSFESPFSNVNRFGQKFPVYPNFNFKVYKYNFIRKRLSYVNDISEVEKIPCLSIKKYFMVLNAYNTTGEVSKLIEQGKALDVISSKLVKIIFSENFDSFAIYLADLKNAFQAVIFNSDTGEIIKVDETMFLDKGRFAELSVLKFDSVKKRFIFSTRDKRKNLIIFNYKSKLYRSVAEHYFSGCFNKDSKYMYILTERDKKYSFTETIFQVVKIDPFWIDELSSRRDISKIEDCSDLMNIKVLTNSGEMLSLDYKNEFSYLSPSYEGTIHGYSLDKKNVAMFNNGYLYFFNNYKIWEKSLNLKK